MLHATLLSKRTFKGNPSLLLCLLKASFLGFITVELFNRMFESFAHYSIVLGYLTIACRRLKNTIF